jgi:hypothetical protein
MVAISIPNVVHPTRRSVANVLERPFSEVILTSFPCLRFQGYCAYAWVPLLCATSRSNSIGPRIELERTVTISVAASLEWAALGKGW